MDSDNDTRESFGVSSLSVDQIESLPGSSKQTPEVCQSTPSITPILDGTFFEIVEISNSDVSVSAKCIKCKPKHVVIKGNRFSSSNYISHLKRRHGTGAFEEYETYMASKMKKPPSATAKSSLKKTSRVISQDEFENNLLKFIVHSMCPLRVIEDKYFIKIFEDLSITEIGLETISRRTLMRRMDRLYLTTLGNIKEELVDCSYVCTTADIWSGKRRSFFGVTAHWIGKDFERKSAALACRRFRNSHSYDRVSCLLSDIHAGFSLDSNKIVATITDNGSNFLKAFKVFGVKSKNVTMDVNFIEAESDCGETSDSESENDNEKEGYSKIIESLPCHLRCAAHTLSLCASADLDKTMKNFPDLFSFHQKVIKKCNKLWKAASRPKSAEILEKIIGHTLSRPGATRWNSLYDALKQIYDIKDKCAELMKTLSYKDMLKENEFLYISEHLLCTRPLALAIDILQGEKDAYYGMLLPTLLALRRKLEVIQQKEMTYCNPIVRSLLESVNTRFSEFFNLTSPQSKMAAIASLCHPRLKKKWLSCINLSKHDEIIGFLKEKVVEEVITGMEESTISHQSQSTSEVEDFFDFGSTRLVKNDNSFARAEIEMLQFFENEDEDLRLLNNFKHIKNIFYKFNTLLPTSAPVERLFSFASMTNTPKAHKLTDEHFEKRVILKANLDK